ncbi:MAG: NAD(P)H-hydrate dehydratase [Candidatus Omnitrophota bacterium]|nr:NAD(P)H-hydrate dehydratase [Candidatus Omnitrophota bacterium]
MTKEHMNKIPERKDASHKGDYGKVLIIAGSRGMTGAAYLASQGALLAGSGLVTCGVPGSLNVIMEIKLTEVMTLALPETKNAALSMKGAEKIITFSAGCDAAAIGPGLGREEETGKLVKELLERMDIPVVLDADGINALKSGGSILKGRNAPTVITPHPGEMARFLGIDAGKVQADREGIAKKVSEETGCIVCLKGHKTVVASPDGEIYINSTGNSGMATGGTGDVLTGMITSFIGQGVNAYSAAVNAVYLHGLAGDIAASKKGAFSMTATDILDNLHEAFERSGI